MSNSHIHPTLQPFLWFAPKQDAEDATPAEAERITADLGEDADKAQRRHEISDTEALRIQQQLQVWRENGGL
jgi:hypothetical protein